MSVIVFNGPPGVGKDEAASFLVAHYGFKALSFKHQLFVETIAYFGVDHDWFMNDYDNRAIKERPEELLGGRSRRQALIHVSEDVLKPARGKGVFGEQVAKQLNSVTDYTISDSGFSEELVPIINTVGAENVCLVQLLRDGCSYDGDSRRYVNGGLVDQFILGKTSELNTNHILPEKFDVCTYRVHNNGTLSEFFQAIRAIYAREANAPQRKGVSREPV